jgi:hypothetical protein
MKISPRFILLVLFFTGLFLGIIQVRKYLNDQEAEIAEARKPMIKVVSQQNVKEKLGDLPADQEQLLQKALDKPEALMAELAAVQSSSTSASSVSKPAPKPTEQAKQSEPESDTPAVCAATMAVQTVAKPGTRQAEYQGGLNIIKAHESLRTEEVGNPQSASNQQVFESMLLQLNERAKNYQRK